MLYGIVKGYILFLGDAHFAGIPGVGFLGIVRGHGSMMMMRRWWWWWRMPILVPHETTQSGGPSSSYHSYRIVSIFPRVWHARLLIGSFADRVGVHVFILAAAATERIHGLSSIGCSTAVLLVYWIRRRSSSIRCSTLLGTLLLSLLVRHRLLTLLVRICLLTIDDGALRLRLLLWLL